MHKVVTVPSSARPVLFKQVCSCGHVTEGDHDHVVDLRAGHIDPSFAGR